MKLTKELIAIFSSQEQLALAPQQINLLNNAVKRVLESEGEDALTLPRLEGIKELVLEHLWPAELAIVEKVRSSMAGFRCLSSHWNLFTATVNEPVIDQVLSGVEGWTSLARTFPVVIGVRTGSRLVLLIRSSEEALSDTESTALAMVAAYDADELFLCSATDALGGLKAFLVTKSRTTEGVGIFFQLTESEDRWVIGDPVGKIDPKILGDFMGAAAFKSMNTDSAHARRDEARQALTGWQSMYDWQFEPISTRERT